MRIASPTSTCKDIRARRGPDGARLDMRECGRTLGHGEEVLARLMAWSAGTRSGAQLVAAISVACLAQWVVGSGKLSWLGCLLYVVATVLGVPAMRGIGRPTPAVARPDTVRVPAQVEKRPAGSEGNRLAIVAAGTVALLAWGATLFIERSQGRNAVVFSIALWLASLFAAAIAATMAGRVAEPRPTASFGPVQGTSLPRRLELVLFAGILLLSLLLRCIDLTRFPPNVHGDHALQGLAARDILNGRSEGFFGLGYFGISNVSFELSALGLTIFGDTLFGLRMVTALVGTAVVLLTYLWTRQVFGVRVAVIAAFLTGVAHFSIHYSRDGCFYIQATMAVMLTFVAYWRALRSGRAIHFLLVGFGLALCLAVYWAAWIAWVVVGLFELHRLATERRFRLRQLTGWVVIVAAFILAFSPWGLRYVSGHLGLIARPTAVFVLNPEIQTHLRGVHHTTSPSVIILSELRNVLEAFNYRGDGSGQYGWPGPLLDFWTSALFVLGFVYSLTRLREPGFLFCAFWFWSVAIIGGALTGGMPFSPRLVVFIPVVFIFPALVLDRVVAAGEAVLDRPGLRRGVGALPGVLVGVFLLLPFGTNYIDYFRTYAREVRPADDATLLGYYLAGVERDAQVFLVCPERVFADHPAVRFLSHDAKVVEVGDVKEIKELCTRGRPVVAIILACLVPTQGDALMRLYPRARCRDQLRSTGDLAFRSCLIWAPGGG